MTLSSTISRKSYDGDGSTASFNTVFVFDANEDVKVYLRDASGAETPWVEGTEYELTGANTGSAGTLTVETSPTDYTPASGEKLILIRDPSQVQESPFPLGGPFPSEVAERANDRQVMLIQALQEKLNRTPKFSVTSSASGAEIPDPDEGKSLVWGASGNLQNGPTSDEISAAQGFASAAAASASSAADSAAEAATFDPDNYALSPVSTTENNVPQWDSTTKQLKDGLAVGVASGNIQQVNQAETTTASATTTTLGTTLKHGVTGTTTITAFNGVAGVTYHCRADGAFTLTHDATDLDILQTGANITTAADDTFDVYMRTTTTCEIRNYQRASGEALSSLVLGTPTNSTSGTAIDYSLTSGIKRFTLSFAAVSINAATDIIIQLGDSGGFETSDYVGVGSVNGVSNNASSYTTGFGLFINSASIQANGCIIFNLIDESTNTWACSGSFAAGSVNLITSGVKSLSAAISQVRVTTFTGTALFDNGKINILEG